MMILVILWSECTRIVLVYIYVYKRLMNISPVWKQQELSCLAGTEAESMQHRSELRRQSGSWAGDQSSVARLSHAVHWILGTFVSVYVYEHAKEREKKWYRLGWKETKDWFVCVHLKWRFGRHTHVWRSEGERWWRELMHTKFVWLDWSIAMQVRLTMFMLTKASNRTTDWPSASLS